MNKPKNWCHCRGRSHPSWCILEPVLTRELDIDVQRHRQAQDARKFRFMLPSWKLCSFSLPDTKPSYRRLADFDASCPQNDGDRSNSHNGSQLRPRALAVPSRVRHLLCRSFYANKSSRRAGRRRWQVVESSKDGLYHVGSPKTKIGGFNLP